MSTDLDVYDERTAALEVRHNQIAFTAAQETALRTIGLDKCTPDEFQTLLHASQRHDLDPLAKQITMIPTWDSKIGRNRHSIHITIDGYLALAERTGRFIGIEGPYWCGQDGQWTDIWLADEPPAAARVTVRYWDTRGIERTANGTVTYKDRVRRRKDGEPMAMWSTMPAEMLANGALRMAIRRGLPEALDTVEAGINAANRELDQMELPVAPPRKALHVRRTFNPDDPCGLDELDALESGQAVVERAEVIHAPLAGAEELPPEEEGVSTRAEVSRIKMLQRELDISDDRYRARLRSLYGVESSKDLTPGQAAELIRRLEDSLAQKRAAEGAEADSAADAAATEEADPAPVADDDVADAEIVEDDDPFALGGES